MKLLALMRPSMSPWTAGGQAGAGLAGFLTRRDEADVDFLGWAFRYAFFPVFLATLWRCFFCGTVVFAGVPDAGLAATLVAGCPAGDVSAFFVVFLVAEELFWVALVAVLVVLILRGAILAGVLFFAVSFVWVRSAAHKNA